MTYIQKTYGISSEQEQRMIRDGIINPIYNRYWDIFVFHKDMLKAYKGMPQPKMTAVEHTCEMWRISQITLYRIIKIFKL